MQSTQNTKILCALLSAGAVKSHESISHGPLFSAQPRKTRWERAYTLLQAILMAYDPSASLKDRFENARQSLVEMFAHRARPGKTYQGWVKALCRIPTNFREQIQQHLCQGHQKVAGSSWRLFGWIPFAADGSRVEVPRTQANQEALGCAGRKKTGPQLLLTTLYHLGSGLPWRWRIGPGTDAERTHLRSLLKTLPAESLLVADAGFTGYELFKELLAHQLSFLIRVGANVTLLTGLGYQFERQGDVVWLWPQSKRDQAPLKLRLICLRVKTKYPRLRQDVYLLTNVFSRERLSEEVAGIFYQKRWGVEVFYRSFKQTLGHRKLRSRSPALAQEELHWSLTAFLLLGLLGVAALVSKSYDPLRLSVAAALRKVRLALRTNRPWRYLGDLRVLLRQAVKDTYKRQSVKKARAWPHKKNERPPGIPKIRPATAPEIACVKRSYKVA